MNSFGPDAYRAVSSRQLEVLWQPPIENILAVLAGRLPNPHQVRKRY